MLQDLAGRFALVRQFCEARRALTQLCSQAGNSVMTAGVVCHCMSCAFSVLRLRPWNGVLG